MPTTKDEPQPTEHQLILRQQMTDDFALLRELGYAPAEIFDVMGRPVFQKEIHSAHEYIKTSSLQPGQYFYRITKDGVRLSSGKLLIL